MKNFLLLFLLFFFLFPLLLFAQQKNPPPPAATVMPPKLTSPTPTLPPSPSLSPIPSSTPLQKEPPPLKEGDKFQPYMAEHMNDGCPANSYCSILAGLEKKRWVSFLEHLTGTGKIKSEKIEDYRKKNGIPMAVWVAPDQMRDKDVISWDSRCLHHQKEGNIFYIGEIF